MIPIETLEPSDMHDVLAPWPEWLTSLREHQSQAIYDAMSEMADGKKTIILSAPTGAGKTVIAEGIRRALQSNGSFICSTKSLQQQFMRDFPEGRLLQGRSNYPTLSDSSLTKLDCDINKARICSFCTPSTACPYSVAKEEAIESDLAVLNTSYWLYATSYTNTFTDRTLTVVDEGDLLHDVLCDFAGVTIPAKIQRALKLELPSNVTDVDKFNEELPAWAFATSTSIVHYARNLVDKKEKEAALAVAASLEEISDNMHNATFIIEGTKGRKAGIKKKGWTKHHFNPLVIKAVESAPVASYLTDHVDYLLIMSATVLSAQDIANKLNLPANSWASVEVDSPFEPRRRIVVARADAEPLTSSALAEGLPRATAQDLSAIFHAHKDERILVHVPSYKLAKEISNHIPFRRPEFSYTESANRDSTLAEWLKSEDGILISPSFARGIDLKGDLCRVQIVTKIPFCSLGSPQVVARLYNTVDGSEDYAITALREFIQACGRVCRSSTDYGVTYCLDGKLWSLRNQHKKWFPKWFVDSIVKVSDARSSSKIKRLVGGYEELSGIDVLQVLDRG